jgi:hypothetical protein
MGYSANYILSEGEADQLSVMTYGMRRRFDRYLDTEIELEL